MTGNQRPFLAIGKVVKAQGIKGEVKILPYSGDASQLTGYQNLYLRDADGAGALAGPRTYQVRSSRCHGRFFVVLLVGLATRNEAEELVGHEVLVAQNELPDLADDEFYWHKLVGMRVVTDEGQALGTVAALFATGAHDVLVVKGGGHEHLIPARREFIVEIDYAAGRLVISPPPGLLDMNL